MDIEGFSNLNNSLSQPSVLFSPEDEGGSTTKKVGLPKLPRKKVLTILGVVVALILLFLVIRSLSSNKKNVAQADQQVAGDKVELPGPKKATQLNKELTFPIKDDKGKEISKLKFNIENAELRDQIIVKGQRASSVTGRTFLVLNIKITNDSPRSIQINTRDFVRLSTNGNENEWLAPDIHNDPVEIQAISTKYTRLGFPINDADTNLKLRVGEIDGPKEDLLLNFSFFSWKEKY